MPLQDAANIIKNILILSHVVTDKITYAYLLRKLLTEFILERGNIPTDFMHTKERDK